MRKINLGIMGFGEAGQRYCKNIISDIPEFNIVAISDPTIDNQLKKKYPSIHFSNNPSYLFNHSGIEALLICMPYQEQAKFVHHAIKKGKYVFSDSLFALSPSDQFRFLQSVETQNAICHFNLHQTYSSNIYKLKDFLNSQKYGSAKIIRIKARTTINTSQDNLPCLGELCLAYYLINQDINSIYAHGSKDTLTLINVKFADGTLCTIEKTANHAFDFQSIDVITERGQFKFEQDKPTIAVTRSKEKIICSQSQSQNENIGLIQNNALRNFALAIDKHTLDITTVNNAFTVARMAYLAQKSQTSNAMVHI